MFTRRKIGSFLIFCPKSRPSVGPVDFFIRHIVHGNRNAQHGSQCDQISSHMAIYGDAMVRTPIGHNAVHIPEGTLAV